MHELASTREWPAHLEKQIEGALSRTVKNGQDAARQYRLLVKLLGFSEGGKAEKGKIEVSSRWLSPREQKRFQQAMRKAGETDFIIDEESNELVQGRDAAWDIISS